MSNIQELLEKEQAGAVLTPSEKRELISAVYRGEIPNNRNARAAQIRQQGQNPQIQEFQNTDGYRRAVNKMMQYQPENTPVEPQDSSMSDQQFKNLRNEFGPSQDELDEQEQKKKIFQKTMGLMNK